jgi:recombination protein RecA
MAKKKKEVDNSSLTVEEVNNVIFSKYGDVIKTGNKIFDNLNNLRILSVSPSLDLALGGGLREGSMVIITSDPKSGKTTTALHFAAKHQSYKNIIYVNTENRLSKQNFEGIKGLNPEKIYVVESSDDRILSAEDYLTIIEQYTKLLPDSIIIVDSTSNMIPKDELDGEIKTGIRNALPRLLSLFCKKVAPHLLKNRTVMIMITHNIANTSGMGKSKFSDCGNMIKYQAATNISINYTRKWEEGEEQIGQQLFWEVITSNSGGTPGSEAESWLRYGIGIDENQEMFQIALELGLIKQSGAWYKLLFLDEEKMVQGGKKVIEFLVENPEQSELLKAKIKEALYN